MSPPTMIGRQPAVFCDGGGALYGDCADGFADGLAAGVCLCIPERTCWFLLLAGAGDEGSIELIPRL